MAYVMKLYLNNWILFFNMCLSPVIKYLNKNKRIQFPCGGCIGCRLDNLMLWTARCESEFVKTRSAFITLTYNDIWLQERCFPNKQILPSLIREDLNRFLDRLRVKCKRYPLPEGSKPDFKYFACGEYGNELRCHFHLLVFGLDFHDCKKLIESCWHYGFVKILPILDGGIRYVVDYFTKNQTGAHAVLLYDNHAIERPFKSNSKGLGFDFFYKYKDEINVNGFVQIGRRKIFPPTYYINLFSDFSEDCVNSRLIHRLAHFNELKKDAQQFGYDVYKYQSYLRNATRLSLITKFRDKGVPVDNSGSFSCGIGALVSQVENILLKEGYAL